MTTAGDAAARIAPSASPSFRLRHYALLTTIATYALIVIGGVVRSTDSGTACPDWPLCHGEVIPPMEAKVWIEFTHRLVASVVGFMILGLAFVVWTRYKSDPPMRRAAIALAAVLGVQVLVGGLTVGTETAAGVVAIHLTIALSLFSILILVTTRLMREGTSTSSPEVLPLLVVAVLFVLIISGAFVSQRHAGLAYPDWPLFDGQVTPANSEAGHLHYWHRIVAGVAGLLTGWLWLKGIRVGVSPAVSWGLTAALLLFIAQVLLGASNVWLDLHESVRILHLALASAVWAVLVFTMLWAWQSGQHMTKGAS
jgi:heme A synthase